MSTIRTYDVAFIGPTCSLRGSVTANSREQAMQAAEDAWNIKSVPGTLTATQQPGQAKAEAHARHEAMDDTLEMAA